MATIKQIAEIAGVSRGTVDRVLNQRGSVRPETARRILEVVQTLDYTPNAAARNLAVSKRHLKLGCVLFPASKIRFFQQITDSLEQKCRELQQYGVCVEIRYNDRLDPAYQDSLIDELVSCGVHGLVLYGFNQESTRAKIAELAAKGIPVITANTDIPDSRRLSYVGCDYVRSGRIAANLLSLLLNGRGTVGVVQGAHRVLCLEGRLKGFAAYLSENAPEIRIVSVKKNLNDDFVMFSAVQELLNAHPDLDAILVDAGNNYGACRAVEMFSSHRRPRIICYDCSETTPEMLRKGIITATICQQPQIQGALPFDLLVNLTGLDIPPEKEYFYTDLEIKIAENL